MTSWFSSSYITSRLKNVFEETERNSRVTNVENFCSRKRLVWPSIWILYSKEGLTMNFLSQNLIRVQGQHRNNAFPFTCCNYNWCYYMNLVWVSLISQGFWFGIIMILYTSISWALMLSKKDDRLFFADLWTIRSYNFKLILDINLYQHNIRRLWIYYRNKGTTQDNCEIDFYLSVACYHNRSTLSIKTV